MDNKSPHILNTSANLLGFTFIMLTSVKSFGLPQGGALDEFASICIVLFAASCLISFVAMRSKDHAKAKRYELIADYVFLVGLILIALITMLFSFDLINY